MRHAKTRTNRSVAADLQSVSPTHANLGTRKRTNLVPGHPILCEKIVRESYFLEQSVAVSTLHMANASAWTKRETILTLPTFTAPTKSSSPVPSPGRYSFSCIVGGFVRRSSGKIASARRAMFVKLCSFVWYNALSHLRKISSQRMFCRSGR